MNRFKMTVSRLVVFAVVCVSAYGCSPRGSGSNTLSLTPGSESVYEGAVEHSAAFGVSASPGTPTNKHTERYRINVTNLVLDQTKAGYLIASLRRIRLDRRDVTAGATSPAVEENHLVVLSLRSNLSRGYPRPATAYTTPLVSQLEEWYFPPLPETGLSEGAEWMWQETVGLPTLPIRDCLTRYRVTGNEKVGDDQTRVVEESLVDPLPLHPHAGPPQPAQEDALSAFRQRFWIGDREPWLMKFEKHAAVERKTGETRFMEDMTVRMQLEATRKLTAEELEQRKRHVESLLELQTRALQSPQALIGYTNLTAGDLESMLSRARTLEQEIPAGDWRQAATWLIELLQQLLAKQQQTTGSPGPPVPPGVRKP